MKRTSQNTSTERHARRGVAIVEFALMAPVALMITFALIEFSRVNMIRNTAQNAAYEGARAAIIPGGNAATAKESAEEVLATIRVKEATVTVDPNTITNTTPQITVTISIPLGKNMWLAPSYVMHQTMVRSCELNRESTQSGF